jgi:hypothetical protein
MRLPWVSPWLLERLVGRAGLPSLRRRRPTPRAWAWALWKVLLP